MDNNEVVHRLNLLLSVRPLPLISSFQLCQKRRREDIYAETVEWWYNRNALYLPNKRGNAKTSQFALPGSELWAPARRKTHRSLTQLCQLLAFATQICFRERFLLRSARDNGGDNEWKQTVIPAVMWRFLKLGHVVQFKFALLYVRLGGLWCWTCHTGKKNPLSCR